MAFSLVQHTTGADTSTFTTAPGVDTTGADFIAVFTSSFGPNNTPAVSDNKGNGTYTDLTVITAGNAKAAIHYKYNAAVGSGHTWTINDGGAVFFCSAMISAWSSSQTSPDPFDQENGAGATGVSTIQPGSVTPTVNNELVLTGCAFGFGPGTPTVNSGFTISDSVLYAAGNNFEGSFAYLIQTSATAENPTWQNGILTDYAAVIATFKAAAVAPSGWGPLLGPGRNSLTVQ